MDTGTRVTFDLLNGRVVIEGGGSSVLELLKEVKAVAPKLSEVRIISGLEGSYQASTEHARTPPHGVSATRKPAIREFVKYLSLGNAYERIAALAYHANRMESKPSFTVKEMESWFSLCAFKKPKLMKQALSDAKNKYDYLESKGRDQWMLSNGGENRVLELLEKR